MSQPISSMAQVRRYAMPFGMLLCCASSSAFASGFALLEQSASRLGTAFSGTAAAADDASTIFYNPAGLANLKGSELLVVASGVLISSEFNNANSQAALGQPLGNEGGDAGGWNAVPAAYFAMPLNDKFAVGLGVNAPFGLKLEYGNGWMGRYQALNSEIQTYNFNPSLSWRLSKQLSFGVGVNYQRIQAELTNAVNYTAVVAQGLQTLVAAGQLPANAVPGLIAANAGLEGTTAVRGDDSAWGFNAGLLYEFSDDTRVGLSYRSSIDYTLEGSVRFRTPTASNATGAAIIASASAPGATLATGPATVDLKLPEIATASLYHRMGPVELLADVAWTGWSSIQELRIVRTSGQVLSVTPERWEDTWRYSVGATYELNKQWKLRGGVAYDGTNVPNSTRTARLPDSYRTWVAAGAQWNPGGSLVVDVGYAHLFANDAGLNQNDGNTLSRGFLIGEQTSAVDIVSAQIAYKF
ncbi:OmpP1/FadL family transporter [Steroidobacter sp.]|uniref:OmpP1/FadL family transporter n=1 Tax=Steroidobacter sp. TaxID=1978227 RepID=UPI001A4F455B|nr:outer membrane protein transport protein [Steroidobacter sp.]MBL8268661.1 outer membrane protein transport protein [Steroidobacter sp.]